jgi:hypothetical protein
MEGHKRVGSDVWITISYQSTLCRGAAHREQATATHIHLPFPRIIVPRGEFDDKRGIAARCNSRAPASERAARDVQRKAHGSAVGFVVGA